MRILDDFNLASYASIVLGLGDICWIVRDITHNGFDGVYAIIAALFLLGNIGLAIGLRSHYNKLNKIRCKRESIRSAKESILEDEIKSIYN